MKKKGMEIYLAGTLQFIHVELGVTSQPFVLSSINGVSAGEGNETDIYTQTGKPIDTQKNQTDVNSNT